MTKDYFGMCCLAVMNCVLHFCRNLCCFSTFLSQNMVAVNTIGFKQANERPANSKVVFDVMYAMLIIVARGR